MKILSFILAMLILFLTVQPVMSYSDFFAKEKPIINNCCVEKENANSSKKKDDNCCNHGHCDNPFLTCANCSFINHNSLSLIVPHIFIRTDNLRLTNEKAFSPYIKDFWHPPEEI